MWCQHVHFCQANRDNGGMKKRKSLWAGISLSILLSACSTNPVGDFGRIDASKANHVTQNSSKNVEVKNGADFSNPLIFSKLEKKFRLTAHLLTSSNFDISIADRPLVNGKASLDAPISEKALVNSFKANGYEDIKDFHQATSSDLKKRSLSLTKFHSLASQVLSQSQNRQYVNNGLINAKISKAIQVRYQENQQVIRKVIGHLNALHSSYRYVVDYGGVIEPHLSSTSLSARIFTFKNQIIQLEYLN